jgi:hypothetical protein
VSPLASSAGSGAHEPAESWTAALDDLEALATGAEQALASGRSPDIAAWNHASACWAPPTTLGPLPEELRDRAARLLRVQNDVTQRTAARMARSQRQRDVAARMSYAPSRPVPAYVDNEL